MLDGSERQPCHCSLHPHTAHGCALEHPKDPLDWLRVLHSHSKVPLVGFMWCHLINRRSIVHRQTDRQTHTTSHRTHIYFRRHLHGRVTCGKRKWFVVTFTGTCISISIPCVDLSHSRSPWLPGSGYLCLGTTMRPLFQTVSSSPRSALQSIEGRICPALHQGCSLDPWLHYDI